MQSHHTGTALGAELSFREQSGTAGTCTQVLFGHVSVFRMFYPPWQCTSGSLLQHPGGSRSIIYANCKEKKKENQKKTKAKDQIITGFLQ